MTQSNPLAGSPALIQSTATELQLLGREMQVMVAKWRSMKQQAPARHFAGVLEGYAARVQGLVGESATLLAATGSAPSAAAALSVIGAPPVVGRALPPKARGQRIADEIAAGRIETSDQFVAAGGRVEDYSAYAREEFEKLMHADETSTDDAAILAASASAEKARRGV